MEFRVRAVAVGFLVATVLAAIATATNDDADWKAYKAKYKKNYKTPDEDNYRRLIRAENLEKIKKHNADAAAGLVSYTLAENPLIDLTPGEYKRMNGYRPQRKQEPTRRRRRQTVPYPPAMPTYTSTLAASALPATVNWVEEAGWVGPVQNQGQCGSCYTYSAAGAMQGQFFNQTKQSILLSEQNLIDCTGPEGNLGCDGGNLQETFYYVQLNGIESLASYPDVSNITGVSNESCMYQSSLSVMTVSGWYNVDSDSEAALQQAVALTGPVSVAIDASGDKFQLYSGGVYSYDLCSSAIDDLNHAVLAVGYGVYNNQSYWLLKNSWGLEWGIAGYMMMARNDNNMCGVATAATFPVAGWTE